MPFVRFSRDKRGYENVYLVHTPSKRGRTGKPLVLYWYRSPPGVKVGREAFDAATRKTLETQYPDLSFDWDTLAAPPPPVAAVEPWRERRRLRKLQKAQQSETDFPEADLGMDAESVDLVTPDVEALETDPALVAKGPDGGAVPDEQDDVADEPDAESGVAAVTTVDSAAGGHQQPTSSARRARRRRRGRRRVNNPNGPEATPAASSGAQGQEPVGELDSEPPDPESSSGGDMEE